MIWCPRCQNDTVRIDGQCQGCATTVSGGGPLRFKPSTGIGTRLLIISVPVIAAVLILKRK